MPAYKKHTVAQPSMLSISLAVCIPSWPWQGSGKQGTPGWLCTGQRSLHPELHLPKGRQRGERHIGVKFEFSAECTAVPQGRIMSEGMLVGGT